MMLVRMGQRPQHGSFGNLSKSTGVNSAVVSFVELLVLDALASMLERRADAKAKETESGQSSADIQDV
jgi:hypothetical protein